MELIKSRPTLSQLYNGLEILCRPDSRFLPAALTTQTSANAVPVGPFDTRSKDLEVG